MIFESPHKGLMVHIRDAQMGTDPSGYRYEKKRALYADFLDTSSIGSFTDEDGNTYDTVRGGCFDTDEAADRLGWDEEEKEYAEAFMLRLASRPSEPLTLWQPPVPDCPIPEHVYEGLHPNRVLALASETGQVEQFLAWERHTQNRPEVVAGLEKKLGEQKDASLLDEALTA